MKQPTKAIICAAGAGTRFLPQTKAMPKEMLPIIDKPVIQIIVEQVVAAGVTDIIIVTGSTKRSIEDHFDRSVELENDLRENNKGDKADQIKAIAEMANFIYIRQKGFPKGNARPVLNAQHMIDDDEPFFVFYADDFFRGTIPWPQQMKDAYNQTGGKCVIPMIEVDRKDASKYGMVDIGDKISDRIFDVKGVIEKPTEDKIPSTYAAVNGFLLTPAVLPLIAQEKVGVGGEIVLVDSVNELAKTGVVCGCLIDGVFHDAGDPAKYLRAVVDIALDTPKYAEDFEKFLRERLK